MCSFIWMVDTPYTCFVAKEAKQSVFQMKGAIGATNSVYHTWLARQWATEPHF